LNLARNALHLINLHKRKATIKAKQNNQIFKDEHMSENQQRSFTAKIKCNALRMTFFEKIYHRAYLKEHPALFANTIATRNDSWSRPYYDTNNLGPGMGIGYRKPRPGEVGWNEPIDMLLHFRCYDDYYNLQILTPRYLNKYISKNSDGSLGAFPAAGGDTTSFNLLDAELNIITLDDMTTDNPTVYLQARNAGIIKKVLLDPTRDHYCFHDTVGENTTFDLQIIDRNAAPRD
jgi:hypothetical protein